ncbi:MAG: DNA-binding protein [Methylococcaceae bacterium]|nr:DNA-binding protein [Methylococcaceae bacterium]
MTTNVVVIADAGPLIHLDELGSLNILADFGNIIVPNAVWCEVEHHRPQALKHQGVNLIRKNVINISTQVNALMPLYTLHLGEQEALHLCMEYSDSMLLTDDTAARLASKNIGITAHGTLGVLVRAIRRKSRSKAEVLALLRAIPVETTLHIRASLLVEVIKDVDTAF